MQFGVAALNAYVLKVTLWGLLVVERVGLVVSIRVCAVSCSGINCTCTDDNIMVIVSGGKGGICFVYTYVCSLV